MPYKDPAKQIEAQKKWRQSHKDVLKARSAQWYIDNKDQHKTNREAWLETHKNYYVEYRAKYRDTSIKKQREWYYSNPDRVQANRHRRRAREMLAEGTFSDNDLSARLLEFNHKCWVPGCSKSYEHLDHGIPLKRHGTNYINNIFPMCEFHNIQKGTKTLGEYWLWMVDRMCVGA